MLIIRRIDIRSFLRTAFPALLLAEIPLLLVEMANEFPTFYLVSTDSPHFQEAGLAPSATFMLTVSVLNLLHVLAGALFPLLVYNWLVRHSAGLAITLRPVGSSLRLLRIGPARALAVGLLLSGFLAAFPFLLSSIPVDSSVAWLRSTPLLLELNLVSRLLADSWEFQILVAFFLYGGNDLAFAFLVLAFMSFASGLAGGALLWLGATLYNNFAGQDGQYALRLRAVRQERRGNCATFTAQLSGLHVSRAGGISFRIVQFLLLFLLIEAMVRGATPAFLLSILRWPLALLLFNRLARRGGGLMVECESIGLSQGRAAQEAG